MHKQLMVQINIDQEGSPRGVLLNEDPNFPLTFHKATPGERVWLLGLLGPQQTSSTGMCCEKMTKALKEENILLRYSAYWIYGEPFFMDDGDDRWDNMTPELNIDYCPFCGTKLRVVSSDQTTVTNVT